MSQDTSSDCPIASDTVGGPIMPLTFLKEGESAKVASITGTEEVKKFLTGLGFVQGVEIKLVSIAISGLILDVKGSRVALDPKMASKIKCTQ